MHGHSVVELLFGRRLATSEQHRQRVGSMAALPNVGLDALGSAAYGPEAALTILMPAGLAGPHAIGPLLVAVIVLMAMVCLSYWQTIAAYPDGGGSYIVARKNLGERAGLCAAASLTLDYVLNVTIGISAGVGAVISVVPSLQPYTLTLCLVLLAILTLVNLRGVRETGLVFSLPTYAFVGCLGGVMVLGVVRAILAGGHPAPVAKVPELPAASVPLSLGLLLRAFASGCTALTGVEAVSNAVPIFRDPTVRRARRTLVGIAVILASLLVGCAVLSHAYRVGATPPGTSGYQSVLSQIVGAVVGRGAFYVVTMSTILCVLALSANTSFTDFPRVCRLLALDHYLPPEYAHRGRRLVFSTGIVALSLSAGALLVVFGGVTDRLIPLFAIGAFVAFTMSQAGMVRHWQRHPGRHRRKALVVSAVGATTTATTAVIMFVSKFAEGAWVSALIFLVTMLAFHRVHAYYAAVARETEEPPTALLVDDLPEARPPVVIVPVKGWNVVVRRALKFSLKVSPDVRAVQVVGAEFDTSDLQRRWSELVEAPLRSARIEPPRLDVVRSDDRRLYAPLIAYIRRVRDENPARDIAVVVPDMIERRWYHSILLPHHATFLKALLLLKGGPRVIVASAPWHLRE